MSKLSPLLETCIWQRDTLAIEYFDVGNREPTIVFETGLGDNLQTWAFVIGKLENVGRTFAYNRAGYGKSSSTQRHRSGNVIAEELHSLLHGLGYSPPFLLVGHSLGSAYTAIFAQKYPQEVCGMVLVDPMTIGMDELCKKNNIKEWDSTLLQKAIIAIFLPRRAKRELRTREETLAEARGSSPCSNQYPVVVLTAGKGMWSSHLQDAWLDSHSLLAKRYSNCCHIVDKDSSHHIQIDNPQLVADQISLIVKAIFANEVR
jgi:pimeloyl-ACP methyl ester carboxylesterase